AQRDAAHGHAAAVLDVRALTLSLPAHGSLRCRVRGASSTNMSGRALACKGAADPGKLALDLTRAPSGRRKRGAVAQLGERLTGSQEVDGSIPFSSTNSTKRSHKKSRRK